MWTLMKWVELSESDRMAEMTGAFESQSWPRVDF